MAREAEMKINVDIQPMLVALARPGDTIVIAFDRILSDEEYDRFVEQWQPVVDQGIKVACADQVSSMLVVRGDGNGE